MWKLRGETYLGLIYHQMNQRSYLQPLDHTRLEPQADDVKYAEELIYSSLYEFWQLIKAKILKLKKEFIIPVLP